VHIWTQIRRGVSGHGVREKSRGCVSVSRSCFEKFLACEKGRKERKGAVLAIMTRLRAKSSLECIFVKEGLVQCAFLKILIKTQLMNSTHHRPRSLYYKSDRFSRRSR